VMADETEACHAVQHPLMTQPGRQEQRMSERTHRRRVTLPATRVDDWALLGRVEGTLRQHAAESGWTEPELFLTVTDEGGSYEVESVADGQAAAAESRHPVEDIRFSFAEARAFERPGRSVSGWLLGSPLSLISGPG
jgi:hypothetical protein